MCKCPKCERLRAPKQTHIKVIDSVKAQKALECVEELKKIAEYWEEQNTRAFREDTLRMLRKYGFLK